MRQYIGEVRTFAGRTAPEGWALCDGRSLNPEEYPVLFRLIGTTYGGNFTAFKIPDLRSRVATGVGTGPQGTSYTLGETGGSETVTLTRSNLPQHTHAVEALVSVVTQGSGRTADPANGRPSVAQADAFGSVATEGTALAYNALGGYSSPVGGQQSHSNIQPVLAINYMIALTGADPETTTPSELVPEAYIGDIMLVAFPDYPRGWIPCRGASLPIKGNEALHSLLGTLYGSSPEHFNLPNLQGRVPVGATTPEQVGITGGRDTVALTLAQLPAHNHTVALTMNTALEVANTSPAGNYPGNGSSAQYSTSPGTDFMAADAVQVSAAAVGGSLPHENRQPYLGLSYLIALQGLFPSRP
ncbi:hypothetical protein F0P96_03865 [Hymenobacter busanensis]|uniref:Uncharacterized protein n=1 Tax=Hymenobacter busanensis TaxID=2607656 RepID=A0A7L4ZU76_9BACT|nr:tail fiber protein [Hymenobacter busanensis]KAA9339762.1 hypothetical protein F0P96_03865 [Hymenobacter busanensis]QHJ06483.1 hypothetical protein GUY19_03880 [Hymenobacter busanensis]